MPEPTMQILLDKLNDAYGAILWSYQGLDTVLTEHPGQSQALKKILVIRDRLRDLYLQEEAENDA